MRKKNLSSKIKMLLLMYLYYQIVILYVIALIVLISTNGMISISIKSNILLFLIPAVIPILLSIIGVNQISIYFSDDLIKIKSTNVFLWFSKNHISYIQIPKSSEIKTSEKSKYLGLKKELKITTLSKNKHIVNVSILNKKERKKLIDSILSMKID